MRSAVGAAIVGIDWGTTHRRAYALDAGGRLLAEFADDQGLLAARGRFPAALADARRGLAAAIGSSEAGSGGPPAPGAEALAGAVPGAAADDLAGVPVILSGMVGSAQGWREAPYLECDVPLTALGQHLVPLDDPASGGRCAIVPGYRGRGPTGLVDVMRGEETQLLGAVCLGHGDGWFVLPGTHCKWVLLRDGHIVSFATYLTGELFALLGAQGTLAPLLAQPRDPQAPESEAAFMAGFEAARGAALSNVLFACRAQVVGGGMPAADAAAWLSGALIGAEWHDVAARGTSADSPVPAAGAASEGCVARSRAAGLPARVTLLGAPGLVARHAWVARRLGVTTTVVDPRDAYLAALRALLVTPDRKP
jgi:2-dehydro-3-deoxygalactonokinase